MKNRKTAFLLIVVMIVSLMQSFSYAEADYAYIIFGKKTERSGMSATGWQETAMRDGKEAAVLDPDTSAVNMNISMGDAYAALSDGECIDLEVTYYDEGEGKFTLYYDGKNGKTTYPEIIRMKNTCTWKTVIFSMQNPRFNKGLDSGCDVQINLNNTAMSKSGGKIFISEIKARKTNYKSVYTVDFEKPHPGNAYFSDEELVFDASIGFIQGMNVMSTNCNITYEVRDYDNTVMWSKKEENVELGGVYNVSIKPENLKYGVYNLYVTVENEQHKYKSTYDMYFSYAVAARKNPDFGVATHYGQYYPNPEKAMYLLEKAGIGSVRDEGYWATIEQAKGVYEVPGGHPIGKYYDLLKESPVDLLNVIAFGNLLYYEAPTNRYMPENDEGIKAYAEYSEKVAEIFQPEYVEIWNEPNTTGFNPGNASWETYVKMMKASYEKVKGVDENIKVVGGSLVGIPMVSRDTVKDILSYGGGEYMDVLAIHPYIWTSSPMNDNMPNKIMDIENFLSEEGYPDIKIWITEMGWAGNLGYLFTYDQQAAYLVQAYLISKSFKSFEKYYWYDFQCDGLNETNKEHNFGLVNNWNDAHKPWAARKSYVAAAYMNDTFSGAEFIDKTEDEKNGYMYHYRNDGKDIYAVFSTDEVYTTGLATNKEQVTIADMYGNEEALYSSNGVLNILGGEEVTYIIGEDLQLEFSEPTILLNKKNIGVVLGEENEFTVSADEDIELEYRLLDDTLKAQKENNKVKISFNELNADTQKIYLTVKNGDRLLMRGYVTADCIQSLSTSITNTIFSYKNFNRWLGYLTVTNNTTKTPISGTMTFSEPAFFADVLPPVKIPEIMPGETKEIEFHFPEILQKEAYNLNAVIKLNNGDSVQMSERVDFAVATYADKKPVIDGVFGDDEWIKGSALVFNKKEQAYNLEGFSWTGKEDLSGRVCIEYDEDYFYLGATVRDDVFNQENSDDKIWQGDSIQFGVGYQRANGNASSTSYTEVGIALTPEGELVNNYSVEDVSIKSGQINLEEEGAECRIKRDGEITTYELKMPWTLLVPRGSVFTGGKNVAFSMMVNDNDGMGRKGWLEYASGIGLTKNVNLFTFLKLMDKQQ